MIAHWGRLGGGGMASATASSEDNIAARAATALRSWIQKKNKLHVICWFTAMLVAATEALWEGYVLFILAGWPAFILSAVSFFLVTYLIVNAALQGIVPETLAVMDLLRKSRKSRKSKDLYSMLFFIIQFSIVSVLFSLAMMLSIFTFRNTGIWAAGFLFTADTPSWVGIITTLPIKYWIVAISDDDFSSGDFNIILDRFCKTITHVDAVFRRYYQ